MKAKLTQASVARLKPAKAGQYIVRDSEQSGFLVVIGKVAKTYAAQLDSRRLGKRVTTRRSIGRSDQITATEARARAAAMIAEVRTGSKRLTSRSQRVTLGQSWIDYHYDLAIQVAAGERSQRTLDGYKDHVERIMHAWLDTPLADLSDDPQGVKKRHREITHDHGPYMANRAIKSLNMIYIHARDTDLDPGLSSKLPGRALKKAWNPETRRNDGLTYEALAAWEAQRRALDNPIRAAFHLLVLLSGSRPDSLRRSKWSDLDMSRRTLHQPFPKGGAGAAFDIRLSRPMLRVLWQARRAGRVLHPEQGLEFIFPSASTERCISWTKEKRTALSHWGVDLRQCYISATKTVGLTGYVARCLVNHSVKNDVHDGYATTGESLDGMLHEAQRKMSDHLISGMLTVF